MFLAHVPRLRLPWLTPGFVVDAPHWHLCRDFGCRFDGEHRVNGQALSTLRRSSSPHGCEACPSAPLAQRHRFRHAGLWRKARQQMPGVSPTRAPPRPSPAVAPGRAPALHPVAARHCQPASRAQKSARRRARPARSRGRRRAPRAPRRRRPSGSAESQSLSRVSAARLQWHPRRRPPPPPRLRPASGRKSRGSVASAVEVLARGPSRTAPARPRVPAARLQPPLAERQKAKQRQKPPRQPPQRQLVPAPAPTRALPCR